MKLDSKQIEIIQSALLAISVTLCLTRDEVHVLTRGHSESDALFDDSMDRLEEALKILDPEWQRTGLSFEVYRDQLFRRLLAGVRVETEKHEGPGVELVDGDGRPRQEPS